jgi:hypothetical protein
MPCPGSLPSVSLLPCARCQGVWQGKELQIFVDAADGELDVTVRETNEAWGAGPDTLLLSLAAPAALCLSSQRESHPVCPASIVLAPSIA